MTHYPATFFLILMLAGAQDVPSPPKPSDNGPSLEETMKFIQDKVGEIGEVNFAAYVHNNLNGTDGINRFSVKVSNVRAYPGKCQIDYHLSSSQDGTVSHDNDSSLSLKIVREIVVESKEQKTKREWAADRHTGVDLRLDPPTFSLDAKTDKTTYEFVTVDEGMANRIAKALVHAVELCGGGSKDPF